MSSGRARSWALVAVGAVAGILVTSGVTAWAVRDNRYPIPLEEIREFTDVFGAIKANYVEPVEDRKLIQEAISGMLAGLDPHSAFLDGEAFQNLQITTQGEFGGLGIEVGTEEGAIKVIAPIDDTPAARAGVRAGDFIIKIDDKFTRGMNLADAIKLMRGKPQTPILLTVARKGATAPIEIPIIRDVIRVQSVKAHMIEPGYGYVRISQFQDRTTEDLVHRLADLYREGPLKGLVLDLRNDPGGVLNGAIGVSAVFLPADTLVVSTQGRIEDAHRRFTANPSDYLRAGSEDPLAGLPEGVKQVPMVVLVNGASASASEIVAGALQDNHRARLMGLQTFGKGSVQTVIQVRGDRENPAAIKLTTARYFTPSGRSIQAQGIAPDLLVDDTQEGNFARLNLREADLANHLSNPDQAPAAAGGTAGGAAAPAAPAAPATPLPAKIYEFGSAGDFQLQQAMNALKGQPVQLAKPVESVAAAGAGAAAPASASAAAPATPAAPNAAPAGDAPPVPKSPASSAPAPARH
jgi:carboxyl-terminal processing protease